MKRFMFLTAFLVMAVFVLPANADPLPKEVEVINAPDNAVPVQGDVQVTNTVDAQVTNTVDVNVTNTAENPVAVTVTNPASCNATIKGIARQNNAIISPTADEPVDLITLSGPGTFVSSRFVVSGGTEYDRRDTLLVLEIDGNAIIQDTMGNLSKGSRLFNFFGIVADFDGGGSSIPVTIGFSLPVSFQSSLILSATPTGTVSNLEAAVIYGE